MYSISCLTVFDYAFWQTHVENLLKEPGLSISGDVLGTHIYSSMVDQFTAFRYASSTTITWLPQCLWEGVSGS